MNTTPPVPASPDHKGAPADASHSASPDRTTRVPPIRLLQPLQLPNMTPEQAYLLLDAIEWLHAAIWNAHENALVDLVIAKVDSIPVADPDVDSDEIPF